MGDVLGSKSATHGQDFQPSVGAVFACTTMESVNAPYNRNKAP
nr:hypothetical protein [uncultured Oscillibacter sp.]